LTDTVSAPGDTPGGTTVTTAVSDFEAIDEVVLPKETDCAEERFLPLMVTGVPTGPSAGFAVVISGFGFSGSLQVNNPAKIRSQHVTPGKIFINLI
jgi:hypothetical protein